MSQQSDPVANSNSTPSSGSHIDTNHQSPPSPSPTPSLKRTADVLLSGTDSIADLVRKAKASRTAAALAAPTTATTTTPTASTAIQAQAEEEAPMDEPLEQVLTCPICTDLIYRPVTVISCLHTFCGSCLISWLDRSGNCPTCRSKITSIKDDHRTNALLEIFLQQHPDKSRSDEDKEDRDKLYKPGQKVEILPADEYSDAEEDDEEDDDDDDYVPSRLPPCPCCDPEGAVAYGYTCPHPLRSEAPYFSAEYQQALVKHTKCSVCPRTLPLEMPNIQCAACTRYYCGGVFACTSDFRVVKFQDYQTGNHDISTSEAFQEVLGGQGVERRKFDAWLRENNLDMAQIAGRVKDWLMNYAPALSRPDPTTFLCPICIRRRLQHNLVDWWIYERERVGFKDDRPNCWYGKDCRTQRHNQGHEEGLNHACHVTPVHERRNTRSARRDGSGSGSGGGTSSGGGSGSAGDAAPQPAPSQPQTQQPSTSAVPDGAPPRSASPHPPTVGQTSPQTSPPTSPQTPVLNSSGDSSAAGGIVVLPISGPSPP